MTIRGGGSGLPVRSIAEPLRYVSYFAKSRSDRQITDSNLRGNPEGRQAEMASTEEDRNMMQESNPDGKAKNRKSPGRLTVRRGICSIKRTLTTRVAPATEQVPSQWAERPTRQVPSHSPPWPLPRCQVIPRFLPLIGPFKHYLLPSHWLV